jgi:aldose 1-epimerase
MPVTQKSWGKTPAGEEVRFLTLKNSTGFRAQISTYGASLTALEILLDGKKTDVVLGFDSLRGYLTDGTYSGATVGRVAGRISNAQFKISEQEFKLDRNEGRNHLHGGDKGFNSRNWEVRAINQDEHAPSVTLSLHSPDGSNGYPGNLLAETTFTLNKTVLIISYRATTDQPTPMSMTAHPYFNLNGDGKPVNDHELKIFSAQCTALGSNLIPDGRIINISGTEADFMDFSPLGKTALDCFFILEKDNEKLVPAAVARGDDSGLEMEIHTSQPGMQFYTAEGIAPGTPGKYGQKYGPRSGFCIEPMGYPDAVNRPEFPSVILHPGETYNHSTEYRFRRVS